MIGGGEGACVMDAEVSTTSWAYGEGDGRAPSSTAAMQPMAQRA